MHITTPNSPLMKAFLSPSPILLANGLALIRIAVGLMLVYHGHEVFRPDIMKSYTEWDMFKDPGAIYLVYMGKSSELIAGILITLGLLTRVGGIIALGTFCYITFFVGNGRFWYEDQHPFMFALFGLLFLFSGPGAWSLDARLFKANNVNP